MTCYRFDRFTFDVDTHELRRNGVPLPVRPKTAVLMGVLLEQRGHLLSKSALFEQVWHTRHVHDQSLFQAISEIRKLLAPLQPIQTHPNLGYEWVQPVRRQRTGFSAWKLAAAALSVAAVAGLMTAAWPTASPLPSEQPSVAIDYSLIVQSPAMQAFNTGMQQLNQQQWASAIEYFELARRENPLFLEAGIMQAEALLEQADYVAASELAHELLLRAEIQGEAYVQVAAQGLLSRISEHSGEPGHALEWALQADSNARDQGFACAADDTRQRIAGLLDEWGLPVNEAWSEDDEFREPVMADNYPDASHCQPLREDQQPKPTDEQSIKPDLSQCTDSSSEYQLLAMVSRHYYPVDMVT